MLYLASYIDVCLLLMIRHFYYFQDDSIFSRLVFASLFLFSCLLFDYLLKSTFCFYFLLSFPAWAAYPYLAFISRRSMLRLSIFLLSSAFCAAFLVRYLTSYLLLFSWFVLFQSASLSPFDSILFPPPAALLLLIYGSLLASYSCLDDWIF